MEKPSCPNCPTFKAGIDHGESGMGYCGIDHRVISWQQWCILKEKGCLSHPQAQEYLMEPVLKELKRRADMFGGEYGVVYNAAIYLIKNGVEK